ncbi:MAG: tetratricopeptide repeat protein, partial [Gammaproteobacteria bacterium]
MTELKNSRKANFSRRLYTAGVFFLCVTLYAPAQADAELNTTGELHASHGMALFEQGKAAFRAGDYTAAIEAYRESQEAGFSTPVLLYNLGVAH